MLTIEIIGPAAGLLVLVLMFMSVRVVPEGYEYTVQRFGKYRATLKPGLRLVNPVADRVGSKQRMAEQQLDIPAQETLSQDKVPVVIDALCFYRISDASKAAYSVDDLPRALRGLCQTNIRRVVGEMPMQAVLEQRQRISERLLEALNEVAGAWGATVTRFDVKDIKPPADLLQAMNEQMKAERQHSAQVLAADGEKQSRILAAQGNKEAAVLEAEGRRQTAFLNAQAREREAEAEARATMMVSQAIEEGSVQAANYFVATRYIESLASLAAADNAKVIMLPLEATSVLGSLSGIAELVAAAGAERQMPVRPTEPPAETEHAGADGHAGTAG